MLIERKIVYLCKNGNNPAKERWKVWELKDMEIWQERAHEDRYDIDWRDLVGHGKGESSDNKAERWKRYGRWGKGG